jgi:hypothetical protein
MQDPFSIAKFYRDKANECLRRAASHEIELGLRLQYERLAQCYSDFAEAEERHAKKKLGLTENHSGEGSESPS